MIKEKHTLLSLFVVKIGNWGPHTTRIECKQCGRWIKWGSIPPKDKYKDKK